MNKQMMDLKKICILMLAALYIILPSYFAFEISDIFPSFTGSRIVLIFVLLGVALTTKSIFIPKSNYMRLVIIYVAIIILVNLSHFQDGFSYSIKAIFSVILENVMLVCILCSLLRDKKNLTLFIKTMVIVSGVVVVFAIVEFLTGYNVFYLLTTTDRIVYQASYIRSGMTRAEASFGHSVYFGVYCSCMLPFSLYLYKNTKKRQYIVIAALNVIGTLITGARGQMIACFIVILLMIFKARGHIKRKYFIILFAGALCAVLVFIFMPSAFSYVLENVKSILNIVGFDFSVSSDYGINADGLGSRIVQLSGVRWIVEKNSLWMGLGNAAALRGLVSYYWSSYGWQTVTSVDVGYVGWLLEYGIIGAIGYIVFFGGFLKSVIKKSNESEIDNLYNPLKWFMIGYMLNLLSSTGVESMLWTVIGLVISYERIRWIEIKN